MAEPPASNSTTHIVIPAPSAIQLNQSSLYGSGSGAPSFNPDPTTLLQQSFKEIKSRSANDPVPAMALIGNTVPACPLDNINSALWPAITRFSTANDNDQLNLSFDEVTDTRLSVDEKDLVAPGKDKGTVTERLDIAKVKGVIRTGSIKIRDASISLSRPASAVFKGLRGGAGHKRTDSSKSSATQATEGSQNGDDRSTIEDVPRSVNESPRLTNVQVAEMIRSDLRSEREVQQDFHGQRPRTAPAAPQCLPLPSWQSGPYCPTNQRASRITPLHPHSRPPAHPIRPRSASATMNAYTRAFGLPEGVSARHSIFRTPSRPKSRRRSYHGSNPSSRPSTSHGTMSLRSRPPTVYEDGVYTDDHTIFSHDETAMDRSTLISHRPSSSTNSHASSVGTNRSSLRVPTKRRENDFKHYNSAPHLARTAHRPDISSAAISKFIDKREDRDMEALSKSTVETLSIKQSRKRPHANVMTDLGSNGNEENRDIRIFVSRDGGSFIETAARGRRYRIAVQLAN